GGAEESQQKDREAGQDSAEEKITSLRLILRRPRSGRLEGWGGPNCGPCFETRCSAALLSMGQREADRGGWDVSARAFVCVADVVDRRRAGAVLPDPRGHGGR